MRKLEMRVLVIVLLLLFVLVARLDSRPVRLMLGFERSGLSGMEYLRLRW